MSEETRLKMSASKKRLHVEGKLFTAKHKENISKALTGRKLKKPIWNKGKHFPEWSKENHWNWKGGIKNENDRRKSMESVLWRESVFQRDDWTCQKYKVRGGVIRAHHIFNYASCPELRNEVSNGITLSDKAHKEFHKRYGKKNNTPEQLAEFLQED